VTNIIENFGLMLGGLTVPPRAAWLFGPMSPPGRLRDVT
jgi:hypothetical protein